MLLLARKRRKITQTALSERTGVPQTLISRLENSILSEIDDDQLARVAHELKFPISFFESNSENVNKKPISLHSAAFRKSASSSQKKIDFSIALANHYVFQIRKLLDVVDLEPQFSLPAFEIVDHTSGMLAENARAVASPEEAAQRLREILQVGPGPIENLTSLVEACGIVVVHADFEDVDVDGITIRPTDLRPIIFINRNRPACRQRFSLAHEIGHAVLHPFKTDEMELEANRFAAEFLMPRADILPDFRQGLSIPRLGKLKLKWRASMSSILYRSKEIRAFRDDEIRSLWIQLSSAGYRTREPEEFDISRERPRILRNLIELHLDELEYKVEDLARLTDTFAAEFEEMMELAPEPIIKGKKVQLSVVVDNSTKTGTG